MAGPGDEIAAGAGGRSRHLRADRQDAVALDVISGLCAVSQSASAETPRGGSGRNRGVCSGRLSVERASVADG